MTIARAAETLAHVPALHHPGKKFTYDFNTDLLGRLIEIWSDEPLDRYRQRAVFEPLEMMDTGFSVPREKRARLTSCYTLSNGTRTVVVPSERLIQIFALLHLPYTEELAKRQFALAPIDLPGTPQSIELHQSGWPFHPIYRRSQLKTGIVSPHCSAPATRDPRPATITLIASPETA